MLGSPSLFPPPLGSSVLTVHVNRAVVFTQCNTLGQQGFLASCSLAFRAYPYLMRYVEFCYFISLVLLFVTEQMMMDCRCCCAISLMLLLQITAPDIVPQVSGTGDPHLLLPLQIATS